MPRVAAQRRGGIYVAVLGATAVVALIGLSSLATLRSQRLTALSMTSAASARLYARSAIELGMQLISSDSAWRTSRTSGPWLANLPIGDGQMSLSVTDADGNLANRPTDAVTILGTGKRGSAVQLMQATLVASGVPLDALGMALHTAGELHIESGASLTVQGAPASTNGSFRNQATVNGSVQCTLSLTPGTVTGSLTLLAPTKAMPPSSVESMYVSLGTAISPGAGLDHVALGPGVNPWSGGLNADGVYVITSSTDLVIRRSRIVGTLVIVCPGRTVTIQDSVFMQPARPDYPALIVDGNLNLSLASAALSEATELTNFNPAGLPYLGLADADTADLYPSEIDGLVHVKGTLVMDQGSLVRGAVICESAAGTNAVDIRGTVSVVYDPALWTRPPMGYAASVSMVLQPGSWKQVVQP